MDPTKDGQHYQVRSLKVYYESMRDSVADNVFTDITLNGGIGGRLELVFEGEMMMNDEGFGRGRNRMSPMGRQRVDSNVPNASSKAFINTLNLLKKCRPRQKGSSTE